MLFNSIEFLIFFAVVITAYFILKSKHRWVLLLAASYYFYMSWNPAYIVLIILSTIVDYFTSLKMEEQELKKDRRKYLLLSLFVNFGLLFLATNVPPQKERVHRIFGALSGYLVLPLDRQSRFIDISPASARWSRHS